MTSAEIAVLKDQLSNGTIEVRAEAAEQLAELASKTDDASEWIVTVYDKLWRPIAPVGEHMMELSGTDPRNNVGQATLKIKGSSPLFRTFRSCKTTMVGVTVETAGLRLAYYVDSFEADYSDKGLVGTANLKSIWDVLTFLQIWPMWYMPIQAQPISHAVYIWAICTVVESMIAEQAMRIQSGLHELIDNALSLNPDLRAWVGNLLLNSGGNILSHLKTPIYVVRTNPFLDTSPLVARTVRMESCATVIQDITRAYGIDVRVDLWLPRGLNGKDVDDPQPDPWAGLQQPTYVVTTRDRSQIEGPTKTVLDSVLRTVVDLGGAFGDLFHPLIHAIPGMDGVVDAPGLGVNFVPPWVILVAPDEGKKGSITTCKIVDHTPKGWQHIIGGRCVSGDTLVHTVDGLVEAKNLDGQAVMTLSQGGVFRLAAWKSYGEQRLFRVTFANGDEILATAQHQWVVADSDERVTTLSLVGQQVPRIARTAVEVVNVEATDRIETVYCCEEPETNTWVTGDGYLTGNSPKWLNDLMNATFAWIIDSISIIIGFTGIPSDLLSGFMNNAFLAFQLIELFSRRKDVGPYHPAIEVFHPTSSAPYNIETLFGFINAFWDSRGYTSAICTFRNGDVYTYGKDIFRGGLASIVFDDRRLIFTDYVENVAFRVSPTQRDLIVQIGDGKAEESPLAKHQRFITSAFEIISVLTLAPQS